MIWWFIYKSNELRQGQSIFCYKIWGLLMRYVVYYLWVDHGWLVLVVHGVDRTICLSFFFDNVTFLSMLYINLFGFGFGNTELFLSYILQIYQLVTPVLLSHIIKWIAKSLLKYIFLLWSEKRLSKSAVTKCIETSHAGVDPSNTFL